MVANLKNRIRLSLYIQQALRLLGVRVASSDWTMRMLNPVAKCNILEGAFGLKKDELVGSTGQVSPRMVRRKLDQLRLDLGKVDPEWLDMETTNAGPLTPKTLSEAAKYVEGSRHDQYMGITADMFATGLWSPEMLPGADGGFMNTSTQPFWYELGRKYSGRIQAGKFGMRDAIGLTKTKLLALVRNHQDLAARRDNDAVGDTNISTYEDASPLQSQSMVTPYFDALDNPNNRRHNQAKEFWDQALAPSLGPRITQVFEAFRHLGATAKGGISGGYQAAADWINERYPENPISTKGVKKAWEKVKEQFAVKFERAKNDPQWAPLWEGLADDIGINAEFSRDRGMQVVYSDDKLASIVNRHAYRQVLRQRATNKTADDLGAMCNGCRKTRTQRPPLKWLDNKGHVFCADYGCHPLGGLYGIQYALFTEEELKRMPPKELKLRLRKTRHHRYRELKPSEVIKIEKGERLKRFAGSGLTPTLG